MRFSFELALHAWCGEWNFWRGAVLADTWAELGDWGGSADWGLPGGFRR
jgi:hypothetical protein